jgi:hypothetical protein
MFQAYFDDGLWPYMDDFSMCYLDNVLINSTNKKEYNDHARQVVQCLQRFAFYCNAKKCQFRVRKVGFHGFVNNSDIIGMESDRIFTI